MSLDHSTEERLLQELRSYFGYADDQIEFAWSDHEGLYEVALFTYNPRHTHRFLFHKAQGSNRVQALQALLEYTQTHRDRELSYTIQWRVAGESELHELLQCRQHSDGAGQILRGKDPHTVQVFSVALNPVG